MLRQSLKTHFGFDQFREGQQLVIEKVINGQSTAAIFPTGSGKSLCYQLSALHMPHLTLVISPLLALMKDQLSFLAKHNIAAASIDSTLSRDESNTIMSGVSQGRIKILMISVERLKNERFRHFIARVPISLLVVDEAHCISEWGHNFRPDYLQLPRYLKTFNIPQSLLLTATATPVVIKDMQNKFAINDEDIVLTGFYRANLHLAVEPVTAQNKNQALLYWINQHAKQSCIVYVTLQKAAEDVASFLISHGINASAYHAGMKNDVRQQIQQDFMQGNYHCIVATIAFGMGIDKSDIRQVIHYDLPKSIENYCQEIGRAGRDGLPSVCVVLANADNLNVLENFVYGDTPELSGITCVLEQIKTTMTVENNQWETMALPLSNLSNIRQLPIKTLLVYLGLNNIIEPKYSYYADYRYKLLQSESELVNHFEGERQTFVRAILQSSDKARTWYTMNFERLYQNNQADRGRAITALEYFNEKNYIELEAKQMTDVYSVLNPNFDTVQLASDLFSYFKNKEQSEIKRIANMLAFFQSDSCLSKQLSQYFGDNQLQSPCGHCSVCSGHVATLPQAVSLKPLGQFDFHQTCDDFIKSCPDTPSSDLIARFLCGISVPIFTKIKARKLPSFGQFEHYRYGEVKVWIEESR